MSTEPELSKHTLNLYAGDYAKLQSLYPDTGAGAIVRRLIRKFLDNVESKDQAVDVDLSIKL